MVYDYFEDRPRNVQEEHQRRVARQVRIRRYLRDLSNPFELSTTEFVRLYRMPQHVLLDFANILRPRMLQRRSRLSMSLEGKVLTAVGFFACGSYQRGLGRSADLNIGQSTVSQCLNEVIQAINHPAILTRYVHFPATNEEREATIERNAPLGMPRVLGYVDGTLISIVPPPHDQQVYRSRKGFTALNVQIVCDADLKIINVDARFPGSSNDPYVYRNSGVREVMMTAFAESRCWLLGDSIYPLEPWLMKPIAHADPGTPEFNYTKLHCHSRNCVERCIGVLKGRWRCLLLDRTLHYKPVKAGKIINSCVVLHNYLTEVRAPPPLPVYEDVGAEGGEELLDDNLELLHQAEEVQRYLVEAAHERYLQLHALD